MASALVHATAGRVAKVMPEPGRSAAAEARKRRRLGGLGALAALPVASRPRDLQHLRSSCIVLLLTRLPLQVSRIKERVEEKEGIPPAQQRLIFGGKQMHDDKTAREFGVEGGSVLHVSRSRV